MKLNKKHIKIFIWSYVVLVFIYSAAFVTRCGWDDGGATKKMMNQVIVEWMK